MHTIPPLFPLASPRNLRNTNYKCVPDVIIKPDATGFVCCSSLECTECVDGKTLAGVRRKDWSCSHHADDARIGSHSDHSANVPLPLLLYLRIAPPTAAAHDTTVPASDEGQITYIPLQVFQDDRRQAIIAQNHHMGDHLCWTRRLVVSSFPIFKYSLEAMRGLYARRILKRPSPTHQSTLVHSTSYQNHNFFRNLNDFICHHWTYLSVGCFATCSLRSAVIPYSFLYRKDRLCSTHTRILICGQFHIETSGPKNADDATTM